MRKITVITGASSGIGKEFAIQLFNLYEKLSEPREIWLLARSKDAMQEISKSLNGNNGKIVVKVFAIDLAGKQGAFGFNEILQKEIQDSPLEIERLINNAGFGTYGPFEETSTERELSMIDLNCTSLTGICGFSIKFMAKDSYIINVASLAAFMPLGNFAVYAATKAYVLSFTVALAAELKPKGIKVCALCPGSVSTNFANIASNGKRKLVWHGKSPEKVVRDCIKKSISGKKIIITFAKWKILAFLSRFIGKFTVANYTFKYSERPY